MTEEAVELWERLAWTAVLGIASGLAAMATARLAEWGWTKVRHSPPPKPVGLVKAVAHKLGESAAHSLGV